MDHSPCTISSLSRLIPQRISTLELSDERLDLIRIENERYLRRHPELRQMIQELMVSLRENKSNEVLPYGVMVLTSSQIEPDETFSSLTIIRHYQMSKILSRD
jgi:hypothetical protein